MGGLKEAALRRLLADAGSVVVAFSGGADSAYLAWVAHGTLGDRALAVTADSPSYPSRHRDLATRVARDFGFRHEFIDTHEMARPEYRANDADRCYHCKHELHGVLTALARARGFALVVDGNNADDRGDYRPGRRAARELGVRSPLDEVGLTKAEIRELSRAAGLPTWNEWEYAAAADETRGDARQDPAWRERILGWYSRSSREALPRVGMQAPNAYGVHDLHGLVWEWTEDASSLMVDSDNRTQGDPDRGKFCGAGTLLPPAAKRT